MAMRLVILGEASITCFFNVITIIKRKYCSFMLQSKKYGSTDLALYDYIILTMLVLILTYILNPHHNDVIQTPEILNPHIDVNIKIKELYIYIYTDIA